MEVFLLSDSLENMLRPQFPNWPIWLAIIIGCFFLAKIGTF